MNRMVVKSKVGSDGILHLDLAMGVDEANKEVQVTVEPARPTMTQAEWQAYILATAGSITDPTFERPPQTPLEAKQVVRPDGSWTRTNALREELSQSGREFPDSTPLIREDRER